MKFMDPFQKLDPTDPFVVFFSGLGYQVSWDFSRRYGKSWYEISDVVGLIAQIDMGVPLGHVIEDMTALSEGRDGTSSSNYDICGEDTERMRQLFRSAAEAGREST